MFVFLRLDVLVLMFSRRVVLVFVLSRWMFVFVFISLVFILMFFGFLFMLFLVLVCVVCGYWWVALHWLFLKLQNNLRV